MMTMNFNVASYVTRIEANRTIKDELMERLLQTRPRQRISVTDLLNIRKAYMQRLHPEIQPPIDRKEIMFAGKGFHDLFGRAVSSEEYLEQFVEWNGIVGVIDLYKDVPTELKTTYGVGEGEELRTSRPYYVEQLAMYCAMADKTEGRLVLYQRESKKEEPSLSVYDATFSDLDMVRKEMIERKDALINALEINSPEGLPACPWRGRGCEFEPICGCSDAPEFEPKIAQSVQPLVLNPEEAEKLLSLISSSRPTYQAGLNTLVFPRKAYYESLKKYKETDTELLDSMKRFGHKKVIADAIQFGKGMDSLRKSVSFGDLQGRITYFKGTPTLLRSVRLNSVVSRDALIRLFPHYLLRLAFECALTNSTKGRLIIHYEKLDEESKLMVYDITFSEVKELLKEAEGRLLALKKARDGQLDPKELAPCPSWMRTRCPYQPTCGC